MNEMPVDLLSKNKIQLKRNHQKRLKKVQAIKTRLGKVAKSGRHMAPTDFSGPSLYCGMWSADRFTNFKSFGDTVSSTTFHEQEGPNCAVSAVVSCFRAIYPRAGYQVTVESILEYYRKERPSNVKLNATVRPSTSCVGNGLLIKCMKHTARKMKFNVAVSTLMVGSKYNGKHKVSVHKDSPKLVKKQWRILTTLIEDPNTALLFHTTNHYCLLFGYRSWTQNVKPYEVRQVLTTSKGQAPKQWMDFQRVRQIISFSRGCYRIISVARTDAEPSQAFMKIPTLAKAKIAMANIQSEPSSPELESEFKLAESEPSSPELISEYKIEGSEEEEN